MTKAEKRRRAAKARSQAKYNKTEKGRAVGAKARTKYQHTEKGREANRRYQNSEKCREAQARFLLTEKGRIHRRVCDSRRRARIAGNGGSHTVREIEILCAASSWQCFYQSPRCTGKEPYSLTPETSHIDHKIPVSRHGSENISNMALACPPCNRWKKAMTDKEFFKLIARIASPPPSSRTLPREDDVSEITSGASSRRRAPARLPSQRPAQP